MYIQSVVCDNQTISVFLKSVLSASQIQQKDLASQIGVDPSNVSKWMNGYNMTLESFFSLLDTLHVRCELSFNSDDCSDIVYGFLPSNNVVPSLNV